VSSPKAAQEAEHAKHLISAHPNSMDAALLRFILGTSIGSTGDTARAISMTTSGIGICDALGVESALPHILLSSIAMYRGEWDVMSHHSAEFSQLTGIDSRALFGIARET
jgi:hypothetical protein